MRIGYLILGVLPNAVEIPVNGYLFSKAAILVCQSEAH